MNVYFYVRLGVLRNFFTQRMVKHWNRLPEEAMDASSQQVFSARQGGALGSVSWWGATSPWQRAGTGWSVRSLPTQPIHEGRLLLSST